MRRLFIMRKDLKMSYGKFAAQIGHCSEAYWTNLLKKGIVLKDSPSQVSIMIDIDKVILNDYVNGIFTKTVCEAKNLTQLLKAKEKAIELGLVEGKDFGLINDACLTELTPENEDGTCTTGIWFAPLPDDIAHAISKKYQLFK